MTTVQLLKKTNENYSSPNSARRTPYVIFECKILDGDHKDQPLEMGITHEYFRRQGLLDHLDTMADTNVTVVINDDYETVYNDVPETRSPEGNIDRTFLDADDEERYSMVLFGARDIKSLDRNATFNDVVKEYKATVGAKVIVEENKQRKLASALSSNGNKRNRKTPAEIAAEKEAKLEAEKLAAEEADRLEAERLEALDSQEGNLGGDGEPDEPLVDEPVVTKPAGKPVTAKKPAPVAP